MNQPEACIVRITDAEGDTLGTGFLISADGRIVTCAHVVEGKEPRVTFPGSAPRPAQVIATDPIHDVAILHLEGELPPGAEPARLGHSAEGHYSDFRSRGYRSVGEMQGIPAEGRVLHAVSEYPGAEYMPLLLKSQDIRKGMSGAPVYVPDLGLVVGMITDYWDSLKHQRESEGEPLFADRDTAFATPSEAIAALYPRIPLEDPLADYRGRILNETRLVELAGIPLPRDQGGYPISLEIPLDRVYIRLQALPEAQRRKEREVERGEVEERAGRSSLANALAVLRTLGEYLYRRGEVYQAEQRPEPVDPEVALQENGRLVILGAPGAGKTTLLRYLARHAAADASGSLPIIVLLRDYAAQRGTPEQQSLRVFALEQACRGDKRQRRALEAAVEAGQVLWLVDALDETRGWRKKVAREVADLPGRLVLTSRPVGYERGGLEKIPHFEILPLALQETDKFMRDWFGLLAEQRGEGADWIDARVRWLQQQLATRPRITPLTRNPLLLTFLVVLAGEDPVRDLPTRRAKLYARYVEELLATWEVRRRPKEGAEGRPDFRLGPLTGEAAQAAALKGFTRLGWQLHLSYFGGQRAVLPTKDNLQADLARVLRLGWNLSEGDAGILASTVLGFWEEAGMVDRWKLKVEENGREEEYEYLAFRHLTFQEYAAAETLASLWEKDPEQAWRFLRPRLHHYAWREVILLLSGMLGDATPLVRQISKARSFYERELHRDMCLAASVVGENEVAQAWVRKVVKRLVRQASSYRSRLISLVTFESLPVGLWLLWLIVAWPQVLLACLAWSIVWRAATIDRFPHLQSLFYWPFRFLGLERNRTPFVAALGQMGQPAVEQLIRLLRDQDEDIWEAAAAALGQLGAIAVPSLIKALEDDSWFGRHPMAEGAVKVLRRINIPIIKPVLQGFEMRILLARTAPIWTLASTNDPGAVDYLMRMARRKVSRVHTSTMGYSGIVLSPDSPSVVEPKPGVSFRLPDSGGSRWSIAETRDWETLSFEAPIVALGLIRDEQASTFLIRLLGDEERDVSIAAALALGEIGAPEAVETLARALEHPENDVRCRAVLALEKIGDEQSVRALIGALNDVDGNVRYQAAAALSQIRDPQAVPILVQALQNTDVNVRMTAAVALGEIGDSQAVEPLIQALGDEEDFVWKAVATALGKIGEQKVTKRLIRALREKNPLVRQTAAWILGWYGDSQAVGPLIRVMMETCDPQTTRALNEDKVGELFDDSQEGEHALSAWNLGWAGDPGDGLVIFRTRSSLDGDLRSRGEEALAEHVDSQNMQPPLQTPTDEDVPDDHPTKKAFKKIKESAIQFIENKWFLTDINVRPTAVVALGRIGDRRAVGPLIQLLGDDDEWVRKSVAQSLGQIGDAQAVRPLTSLVDDKKRNVRQAAAEALGEIGDSQAAGSLVGLLRDSHEEVRRSAARALGKLGDAQAVEPLICVLGDRDKYVRREAAGALEGLADRIPSQRLARRTARALWWRLMDLHLYLPDLELDWNVAEAAYSALEKTVARLTELEVAALPIQDPTLLPPLNDRHRFMKHSAGVVALVALGLADLLTNFITNLLANSVGQSLPSASLGWLALLGAAGLGLVLLGAWIRETRIVVGKGHR